MPLTEPVDGRHYDRNFFFACVVLGIVGILVLRNLSSQSDEQFTLYDWLAVGLGVAIIIAYSLFVYSPRLRSSVSLDRAGDNAYYMGLLFTLSSLAFSLYKLSLGDYLEAGRIISLLPDFGVALFCTIVGIAARIALQQFGDDNYVEAIARDELGVAVSRFRQNLVHANHSMRKLNATMQNSANYLLEQIRTSRDQHSKMMRDIHKSTRTLSAEIAAQASGIKQLSKEVTGQASSSARLLSKQLDDIKVNPELISGLDRLSRTLKKLDAQYQDNFETHIRSVVLSKETERALKNLTKFSEATLRDMKRSTKRSLGTSDVYVDTMRRAAKRVDKIARRRAPK